MTTRRLTASNTPRARITVSADQTTVTDFALVPQCFASVAGTLIFGDTRLPVANFDVLLQLHGSDPTDALGRFSLSRQVPLGYNNSSTTSTFAANNGSFGYRPLQDAQPIRADRPLWRQHRSGHAGRWRRSARVMAGSRGISPTG